MTDRAGARPLDPERLVLAARDRQHGLCLPTRDVARSYRGAKKRSLAQRTREAAELLRGTGRVAVSLAHVLSVGGESQTRGMASRAHRIEPLADRDVQRTAPARYANEQRIDGARKPRPFFIAARAVAAFKASRRANDLVEVSRMRRERRIVHDVTLAGWSDIPSGPLGSRFAS